MAYKIPPMHCLITFEALARLRSGMLAAHELSVTPSAITHRIRQLESTMGIVLFDPGQSNFALTAKGAEYLLVVKDALAALNYFPVRSSGDSAIRPFRISAPPTFSREILAPALHAFAAANPCLDISLHVSVPLVGIKAELMDVEIRYGDGFYPGHEVVKVLSESAFAVCSPGYLRDHGPFDTPAFLAKAKLLRTPLEPWWPWFRAAGLDCAEPSTGVQYVDAGLSLEAAANGEGITLARARMARSWLQQGRLVQISPVTADPIYSHYLIYKPPTVSKEDVANFRNWLHGIIES